MANKNKKIGILIGEKAQDTSIIENVFNGLDVAILNNGKRTFATGNKFLDEEAILDRNNIDNANKKRTRTAKFGVNVGVFRASIEEKRDL